MKRALQIIISASSASVLVFATQAQDMTTINTAPRTNTAVRRDRDRDDHRQKAVWVNGTNVVDITSTNPVTFTKDIPSVKSTTVDQSKSQTGPGVVAPTK